MFPVPDNLLKLQCSTLDFFLGNLVSLRPRLPYDLQLPDEELVFVAGAISETIEAGCGGDNLPLTDIREVFDIKFRDRLDDCPMYKDPVGCAVIVHTSLIKTESININAYDKVGSTLLKEAARLAKKTRADLLWAVSDEKNYVRVRRVVSQLGYHLKYEDKQKPPS